jgi:plastocyanin
MDNPESKQFNIKPVLIVTGIVVAITFATALAIIMWYHPNKTITKVPQPAVIHITATGFEPGTVLIKAGSKVSWSNVDNANPAHWVESDPYPTPSNPADLTSGRMSVETEYTYTFNKAGTYHYHDRLFPTHSGTITVE